MSPLPKKKSRQGDVPKPVYASIDVGSHNVRMDLYGVNGKGRTVKIKITEDTVFPCKLAQGFTKKKQVIKREHLDQAVEAMGAFDAILTKYKIRPENTCTVMTAAIRAVEDTKQGKKDIDALAKAFGGRDFTIITGEEEAILVGETVRIFCPKQWKHYLGNRISVGFAAIGGGSVEAGVIARNGRIFDTIALPYGIYPLKEESGDDIPEAGNIFNRVLRKNYPRHRLRALIVTGGYWRALSKAVCKREPPATLYNGAIRLALVSATRRGEDYYESLGGRTKKRAKHLPMSAAVLWRVAKHFSARRVGFLEETIRDTMAHYMHGLKTGRIKTPPRGLERLFSP